MAILFGLVITRLSKSSSSPMVESYERIIEEIGKIPTVDANNTNQNMGKDAAPQVRYDETQFFQTLIVLKRINSLQNEAAITTYLFSFLCLKYKLIILLPIQGAEDPSEGKLDGKTNKRKRKTDIKAFNHNEVFTDYNIPRSATEQLRRLALTCEFNGCLFCYCQLKIY